MREAIRDIDRLRQDYWGQTSDHFNGRNMSAEFSAHINSLQNNHKFPMIVMDCQEFLH